jgi:flagellar hook-length control protein FliK
VEIRLPLISSLPLSSGSKISNNISLQLNQLIEAKVIETATLQNTLTLQIGKQHVQVKNEPLLNLKPGQNLILQVIKLVPVVEFQIHQNSQPTAKPASVTSTPKQVKQHSLLVDATTRNTPNMSKPTLDQLAQGQRTQVQTQTNSQSTAPPLPEQYKQPSLLVSTATQNAPDIVKPVLAQLVQRQRIEVTITQITKNGVDVAFSKPTTEQPSQTKTAFSLSFDQLQLPQTSKAGRKNIIQFLQTQLSKTVTLEFIGSKKSPRFAIVQAPAETIASPIEQQISNAVKHNLPLQDSPVNLLQQLTETLPRIQANESVPAALKRLAQEILQTIPDKAALSKPEYLQQQLMNSGRWLEAKLVQLKHNPNIEIQQDFKLKILQLISQLSPKIGAESKLDQTTQQVLTELLSKANGTLAKIVLDQLNSLPREDGNKQSWLLELPVSYQDQIDKVHIEIELEKKSPEQEYKNRWSVSLTLNPPGLGTIHCKLNCYDQQVSTRFWAEQKDTADKIRNSLDRFKHNLQAQGIDPGVIDVQTGDLNTAKNTGITPSGGLISEQA